MDFSSPAFDNLVMKHFSILCSFIKTSFFFTFKDRDRDRDREKERDRDVKDRQKDREKDKEVDQEGGKADYKDDRPKMVISLLRSDFIFV